MAMRQSIVPGFALLFAVFFAGLPVYAATPEEQQLQKEQQNIDAAAKANATRADTLAAEFGVTPDTVTGLRNQRRGWGSITIELAMAKQLTTTDPAAYPDMTVALAKVEALRAQGQGWGRIARDLGFKLGPVVSAVQQARHSVQRAARMPGPHSTERGAKPERGDHGRPDRPERPSRPDRSGRS